MKTKKALRKAILKWARLSVLGFDDTNLGECALCEKFDFCIGCPIKKKTGHTQCDGTSYYDALRAVDNDNQREFKKQARKMLKLLVKIKVAS